MIPQSAEDFLFPPLQPYEESYLKVSDLHSLWYAQYGNPEGVAVVVIHGGPGAGCGPNDMRYFDPKYYRIILVDQRGAKRSKPAAEMQENTTQHLINDLEHLRKHLQIKRWLLFGGSWGSTLSLLYGETYPEYCLGFILRGIFLGREYEWKQVWYGMQDIFPDAWDELEKFLPPEERKDLIHSYYKRLMNPDSNIHKAAAHAVIKYDMTCSFLKCDDEFLKKLLENTLITLGLARTFAHYCINKFFLKENQVLEDLPKIKHLPAFIVHGRYDVVCRAKSAYELYQHWPGAELVFVDNAGHSALEAYTTKALVETTEKMKTLPSLRYKNP